MITEILLKSGLTEFGKKINLSFFFVCVLLGRRKNIKFIDNNFQIKVNFVSKNEVAESTVVYAAFLRELLWLSFIQFRFLNQTNRKNI